MEDTSSSETLVDFQWTRRPYIQEYRILIKEEIEGK
jgi:hypothetical protein